MKKTVQIGLRIERELLNRIEELADFEKIDKMSWIRKALANAQREQENKMRDSIIDSYLNLRLSDEEFQRYMKMPVPEDIKKARKNRLENSE